MNIITRKIISALVKALTSILIIPKYRKSASESILNSIYKAVLNRNYKANIQRIRNKQGKIRVAFLVNEYQKWNVQSLYDELVKSELFEPIILTTRLLSHHKGKERFRAEVLDNELFFKEKNIPTNRVYDIEKKKYLSLDKYNIDVLFYLQPWELDINQHVLKCSQSMLTCYIPYCFHMLTSENDYTRQFHKQIWTYFVESNLHKISYEERFNAENCIALGHTRMDNYTLYPCTEEIKKKKTIIYAPYHYSSPHKTVSLSWNKDEMLEFARNHQEFDWIFKPHPALKSSCIKHNICSEEEINSYYDEWKKIATIHTQGDNFQILRNSDCLITDCISFLAEYLPTKQPLFMLHSENAEAIFNELGKQITSNYYKASNWKEFEETFNQVIIQDNDYLKENRINDIKCLNIDQNKTVATKIVEYLEEQLIK